MSIPDELRNIRDHLRSGCIGQREVWEQQLEKAATEVERLEAENAELRARAQDFYESWVKTRAALEQKP